MRKRGKTKKKEKLGKKGKMEVRRNGDEENKKKGMTGEMLVEIGK